MKAFTIGEQEKEQRLDRYLMKLLNKSSRGNIYKLLRKKVIKVNGKKAKEDYFLSEGDLIEIFLSDESYDALVEIEEIKFVKVDLDIVHEDEEILIVNKPRGLLVHPDKNEYKNTLATKVQYYLKDHVTRTFKPASIQRLDKNTSGLVIFCKTYDALKKYNEMMRNREIDKFYMTIVEGLIESPGEVKGYLLKDEKTNKVELLEREVTGSKACHTKYKPLETIGDKYTVLEVELLTGRTHQIRVSMAKIGHPIIGDVKYGGKKVKKITTQVLHGYKVNIDGKTYEKYSEEMEALKQSL